MRILVLGAGGVGGYFGGRLAEKGADVTFLVRSQRKRQLDQEGLIVRSVAGDIVLKPNTITSGNAAEPFEVVLFSTKAYHLEQAIRDLKPYVGEETVIIPLLNGVAHYSRLREEFGEHRVIGGLCFIETTLNREGHVLHTSPGHYVVFGEFGQQETDRIRRIEAAFEGTKTSFVRSSHIERDIWHKYLFISTIAGVTTLMRSPIGPIRDSEGGMEFIRSVFTEIESIMLAEGAPLDQDIVGKHLATTEKMSHNMKSSMLRDMEKGYAVEADQLHGYLLTAAEKHGLMAPFLKAVYQNLLVYGVTIS